MGLSILPPCCAMQPAIRFPKKRQNTKKKSKRHPTRPTAISKSTTNTIATIAIPLPPTCSSHAFTIAARKQNTNRAWAASKQNRCKQSSTMATTRHKPSKCPLSRKTFDISSNTSSTTCIGVISCGISQDAKTTFKGTAKSRTAIGYPASRLSTIRGGDQSLLPDELGKGNAGHNVFYMLPLLFGIIGLLWQAYKGKRGIEQFWVVFFLFFHDRHRHRNLLEPNARTASRTRLRLRRLVLRICHLGGHGRGRPFQPDPPFGKNSHAKLVRKAGSRNRCGIGHIHSAQVVSQTWDDHDRSGRYACRDFGMNYLTSVDKNGIIFTSGDNDTFPLWYAQEVEGWRTDVRVVNLSYLATDWYMAQMRRPAYESAPLPMQANNETFAYNRRLFGIFGHYLEHPTAPKSVKRRNCRLLQSGNPLCGKRRRKISVFQLSEHVYSA